MVHNPQRPATRATWSNKFRGTADIYRADGTLYGSPTFVAGGGVVLDGSTDYITFPSTTALVYPKVTIKVVFSPDFAYTEDAERRLFSTDVATYSVMKRNAANNNVLNIRLGNTNVVNVAAATYGPYWNVGERNELVVTGTSGDTDVYLNGNAVTTGAATAWSPVTYTTLAVGATTIGTTLFDGTIYELSIFSDVWTSAEVADNASGATFQYEQLAEIYLPMRQQTKLPLPNSGQLLADGNMEASGTTAWASGNSAVLAKEAGAPSGGSQVLRVTYDGVANAYAYQSILVSGVDYRTRGWARGDGTTGVPQVRLNGVTVWTGTTSATWQQYDVVGVANGVQLHLRNQSAAGWTEFDDVLAIRSGQRLNDGDMEMTGVAEWSVGNGADLSKVVGTGQALQVTATATSTYPFAYQSVVASGHQYRVAGQVRSDGNVPPRISTTGGVALWNGTTSTDWQSFDLTADPAGVYFRFISQNGTPGQYTEWNNVRVEELFDATPDVSNKGNLFTVGDGVSANQPTFKDPGFETDGTSYIRSQSGILGTGSTALTVWCVVRPATISAGVVLVCYEDTTVTDVAGCVLATSGEWRYYHGSIASTDNAARWTTASRAGELVVIVGTGDGTTTRVYVNGEPGANAVTPVAASLDADMELRLFEHASSGNDAPSGTIIYGTGVMKTVLTPTQVRDLTERLLQEYRYA